jgi:hypothetical protein
MASRGCEDSTMTRQKHLKQLVRARMQQTGERYTTARRHVIAQAPPAPGTGSPHLPGSIPLPTALRILLTHAGVTGPYGGAPLSEAFVLGLTGGIGAGVFAFHYEKEDFSSFYVAGRHLWYDDVACLKTACARLGIAPMLKEFGGAGPAEKGLAEWCAKGPVLAWVDMGTLPHRGLPPSWSGGGYHIVTVYQADPGGQALIGDLSDQPIALSTKALTAARGRIKKDKFRILSLAAPAKAPDLKAALAGGLAACREGLLSGRIKNFTVASFGTWADQLYGARGKDSWEKVFPPGPRLWRGLTSIHEFVEYHGTGGGLMRPLFAATLREAAPLLKQSKLARLAEEYDALGREWSALAEAALPGGVPMLDEARALIARKAELVLSGPEDGQDAAAVGASLEALGARTGRAFPLTAPEAAALREALQQRVRAIHAQETSLAGRL